MKIRLTPTVSKRLAIAIFAIFLANSIQVKADQIAQGAVQVTITVGANAALTSATCSLDIGTYVTVGVGTLLAFSTSDSVAAAIQGGTVTCVVTTPYYWSVPSLNSTIGISYSVNAQNTNTSLNKSTSGNFASIPLSTTGTTMLNVVTVF